MLRWAVGLVACISAAAVAGPGQSVRDAPTPATSITAKDLEKLPTNRNLDSILKSLACPAQTLPSLKPGRQITIDGFPARDQLTCLRPDDLRMIEVYKEHNRARAQFGSQPIVWDPELARGAADYARQLTTLGRVHAPRAGRRDVRENLLQSLRGGRSPQQMVGVWIGEKRYFIPGIFPNVSTTGNWADVGHYTQVVWPTTIRLGCAIHADAKYDWTVCRYSPPGNRDGKRVP